VEDNQLDDESPVCRDEPHFLRDFRNPPHFAIRTFYTFFSFVTRPTSTHSAT